MSTSKSYAIRAEDAAAADFDSVEAEGATVKEATAASHAAATAFVANLAAKHGTNQTSAAP